MAGRSEVEVRRAEAADRAGLAALRWEWRIARGEQPPMDQPTFADDFARWCAEHEASHVPFVARVGETAVGMIWLAVVDRVPGPGRWLRRSGIVQSAFVSPEHRDLGVGGLLLAQLVEHARGLELDYLTVHPTERAIPFYRRHGFGERAAVLELALD